MFRSVKDLRIKDDICGFVGVKRIMGKVQVRIKAPFGEIVVEGNSPQEILDTLKGMPSEFMAEISGLISGKLAPPLKAHLEGIVELTTEGPVITTREKLTHYEAIALTLYASEEKKNTATTPTFRSATAFGSR